MTVFPTTKLHIASAERIKASFERIVSKDKKLDDDFTRMNAEIQKRYQEKINQLASTRNQRIAGAEKQAQGQQQLLQAILADLSLVEKRIPDKYRKKVRKTKAAVTPKNPDFQSMSEIVERINDTTFKGQVKRIAHYDGYKTMSEMVNAFKEKIESARTFIHDESQQYYADLAQEKANADQEFQSEKDRADKELPVILQQYKQQYENAERTLMSEFEKVLNSPELPRLDRALLPWLESLGAFSEDWTEYIPSESDPAEVMLGAVEIPFQLPAMVSDLVKERMPVAYASGKSITLPLAFSMREPLNMHVIYDPKQKQSVMAGIQSILLKLIRFMPMSSFQLTAIDPNERGTNLGLLQKLPAISASEICKKVYTLKEDIAERLRELEIFVDQTSAMLAGVEDVYTYNASHAFKIPYHFVVINDYPNNFERNAMESLNVLLNNARKCGISFIFTSVAPYKGSITSDVIVEENNHKTSVNYDRSTYDFVFDDVIANCGLYLESVENAYKEGIKVDNRFCRFFDMQRIPAFLDSTQSMRIPFAVDSMKRLISLELGGSQSAHALLSGRTGSGKSTTLHMLITSIIMHYHPDDVELWLVDYKKVEFNEYGKNLPPHLKLLGVERDPEFTFSLLDKIEEEFQRRMELFKSKGVNNITEYKQRYGVRSLPRIIFIVDEFHHMTQAIQNEPRYVVILENILSEYRVFGLSCVFSDQAISVGLRGLTEKGKNQISIRIAMENEIPEIRSTLALANNLYDDSMNHRLMNMTEGDVIFKRFSASNQEMILDLYKTIYITKDERSEVIRQANLRAQGNYVPKDLLIIDGQNRREYEESEVVDFENKQCVDTTRQIPIYMGTPINFAPCFFVFLRKKTAKTKINIHSVFIAKSNAESFKKGSINPYCLTISHTRIFHFSSSRNQIRPPHENGNFCDDNR